MERIEFSELTNRLHRNLVAVGSSNYRHCVFWHQDREGDYVGIEVKGTLQPCKVLLSPRRHIAVSHGSVCNARYRRISSLAA